MKKKDIEKIIYDFTWDIIKHNHAQLINNENFVLKITIEQLFQYREKYCYLIDKKNGTPF